MEGFKRHLYYSQTEVCKLYKLTPKRFKEATEGLNLIKNEVTLHTLEGKPYTITTLYVLKLDWYKAVLNDYDNLKKI